MGVKEQGAATAREAGSGMATGRAFPETNVAQSDAEGGGIAIDEEGVQRINAGLQSAGGQLAQGASRGSDEGDSEDAARLSTNMTIERQTQKRDFGE